MGISGNIFSVHNLSFSYKDNPVLNNVSCVFEPGKLTVILGRNGSGKSTLLRLMAGLLEPDSGSIMLGESPLKSIPLARRSRIFGFMSQRHQAVFPFRIHEVVLTGRAGAVRFTPSVKDKEAAARAIERMGISPLFNRYYTELSGGEQQLVMIARVLAQEPEILLLDEPASSLDFSNQIHLMKTLKELTAGGLTVIAVLHDPNTAFQYGDDFAFLRNGQLEKPGNDVSSDFLTSIFETPVEVISHNKKSIIIPKSEKNDLR